MNYKDTLRFICFCVFLFSIGACGKLTQSGQNNTSTGNSLLDANKTTASDASRVSGDARAEVVKAFQTLFTVPSYHLQTVGTDSDGKNSTVTMDYVSPDRYEIKRHGDPAARSGSKKTDMISVGNDTWVKVEDQSWKKSPVKLSMVKDMQKEWLDKVNDKNSEVKSVGTEIIDGATMNVYQLTYNIKDEDAEETYKGAGKVWVGAADHLLHKSETESQMSDNPKPSRMTTTYDYKTDIKIESPM
jgi:hypothetical protein